MHIIREKHSIAEPLFSILHKRSLLLCFFHYIVILSPILPSAIHFICLLCTPTSSPLVQSVWGTGKWSSTCTGSSCHLVPVRSCRPNHNDKITPSQHIKPKCETKMCGCVQYFSVLQYVDCVMQSWASWWKLLFSSGCKGTNQYSRVIPLHLKDN